MKEVRVRLLVVAAMAPLLAGQEQKAASPEVQVLDHPDGLARIEIPASWKIERLKFGNINTLKKAHDVMRFDASAGPKNLIEFYVSLIHPAQLRPLAQAWYEGSSPGHAAVADRVGVYKDPLPHVIWIDKARPKEYRVLAFRRERTRGFHFTLYCRTEQWAALKPSFFQVVSSATVKCEPWLKPSKKRVLTRAHDAVFSTRMGVRAAEFKDVQKTFASIVGRLEKIHGPRWQSVSEPLTIQVSALSSEHREFKEVGIEVYDVMGWVLENRILTVPLGATDSSVRKSFTERVAYFVLAQTYGETADWMLEGEHAIAGMAEATGRKLPYVTREFHRSIVPTGMTLEQILKPSSLAAPAKHSHLVSYVALFHIGPSTYRKAYKAFLTELRETCDGETALKKHLLSLGQGKMRRAAAAITKRMKPPKARKR